MSCPQKIWLSQQVYSFHTEVGALVRHEYRRSNRLRIYSKPKTRVQICPSVGCRRTIYSKVRPNTVLYSFDSSGRIVYTAVNRNTVTKVSKPGTNEYGVCSSVHNLPVEAHLQPHHERGMPTTWRPYRRGRNGPLWLSRPCRLVRQT